MPTQLFMYDFNDTVNGSAGDDFIVAFSFLGSADETLNGGDGDDYILADSSSLYATGTSNFMASPARIDNSPVWTLDDNPFIANSTTTPHTSIYVLADAGQMHYSSVTVGAGQAITIDIDFGLDHPIGVSIDVVVEVYDSLGVLVAFNDDASRTLGGAGSVSIRDSFLTFTNATGTSQIYTIRFRAFSDEVNETFEGGETFVANISVTGHAVGAPTVMGNDILIGGNGDDTIAGQGGDDSLSGDAGNDTLFGGAGSDTASYASAATGVTVNLAVIIAQDTVGAGRDILLGIENLIGSGLDDTLTGDGLNNILFGGIGNDALDGGDGDDTLNGGTGVDVTAYTAAAAAVTVNLGVVAAQNTGGAGIDTLAAIENVTGSSFNDTLTGNDAANVLNGRDGNDSLNGSGGNDTLFGGAGNDSLNGGAGNDTASYSGNAAAVTLNLNLTGAQDTGGAGSDTLVSIERLIGSGFNDTLTGNALANVLRGDAGVDVLDGAAGDDILLGGDGNDRLICGAGNDTLNGGAGFDTASYATNASAVTVTLASTAAQNTGGAGTDILVSIEHLTGSGFNDTLTGSVIANTLLGGGGNDTLSGGGGHDALNGGTGADLFRFDSALSAATNVDNISAFSVADDTIELSQAVFTAAGGLGTLAAAAFHTGAAAANADDRIIYNSATGQIFYDADGTGAGAQIRFAQISAGLALTNADFSIIG